METYLKIENLINNQKEKKEFIEKIFSDFLLNNLNSSIKLNLNINFVKPDLIRVKILNNSSVKFVFIQNKEKLINEFKEKYGDIVLIIN